MKILTDSELESIANRLSHKLERTSNISGAQLISKAEIISNNYALARFKQDLIFPYMSRRKSEVQCVTGNLGPEEILESMYHRLRSDHTDPADALVLLDVVRDLSVNPPTLDPRILKLAIVYSDIAGKQKSAQPSPYSSSTATNTGNESVLPRPYS